MITNLKNLHSLFLSVWYFHILLIWMLTSITIFSISLFPCLRNICNKNVYYLWTTTDCAIRLLLYIHNCSSVHLMHHNPSLELDKLIPLSFLIIVPLDPQYMPFFTILSSYKVVKSFWMNRQLPPKAFFSYVYSIKYSFINVLRWMILSFRNAKPHHQRSELSSESLGYFYVRRDSSQTSKIRIRSYSPRWQLPYHWVADASVSIYLEPEKSDSRKIF